MVTPAESSLTPVESHKEVGFESLPSDDSEGEHEKCLAIAARVHSDIPNGAALVNYNGKVPLTTRLA